VQAEHSHSIAKGGGGGKKKAGSTFSIAPVAWLGTDLRGKEEGSPSHGVERRAGRKAPIEATGSLTKAGKKMHPHEMALVAQGLQRALEKRGEERKTGGHLSDPFHRGIRGKKKKKKKGRGRSFSNLAMDAKAGEEKKKGIERNCDYSFHGSTRERKEEREEGGTHGDSLGSCKYSSTGGKKKRKRTTRVGVSFVAVNWGEKRGEKLCRAYFTQIFSHLNQKGGRRKREED